MPFMSNIPTRRDRKKAEIRLRIVQCAMRLFRERGLENTTMESIAEVVDVAKRTLYSYFPVKESIVSAYWMNNAQQKSEMLPDLLECYPDTRSRLVAVFLDAAQGFKAEPEFARVHFSYQFQQIGKREQPNFHNDFGVFLTAVMKAGQVKGDIRGDVSASELATQAMFNFTAICLIWFSNLDAFSIDERLVRIVDCFIDGAGTA